MAFGGRVHVLGEMLVTPGVVRGDEVPPDTLRHPAGTARMGCRGEHQALLRPRFTRHWLSLVLAGVVVTALVHRGLQVAVVIAVRLWHMGRVHSAHAPVTAVSVLHGYFPTGAGVVDNGVGFEVLILTSGQVATASFHSATSRTHSARTEKSGAVITT